MVINTFDQKMPNLYRAAHMAWRLQYFIDNFILPSVLKKKLIAKERDEDVTLAILDKDRMVLRYLGEDLGAIILIGSDFTFVSKK